MKELSIRYAQHNQPWTVPYSEGIMQASSSTVPHVLASHCVLHAAKTIGKLAAVFEAMDHGEVENLETIRDMSADLLTEALRFANLFGFDLSDALERRVYEKNGVMLRAKAEPGK